MGWISDILSTAAGFIPGAGPIASKVVASVTDQWTIGKTAGTTVIPAVYKEVVTPAPSVQTPSFWTSGKPNVNAAYGPIGLPLTKANFPDGGPLPGYSAYVGPKVETVLVTPEQVVSNAGAMPAVAAVGSKVSDKIADLTGGKLTLSPNVAMVSVLGVLAAIGYGVKRMFFSKTGTALYH